MSSIVPQRLAHASRHRWRHLQRLVDADEIVEGEIERQGVDVVLEFLAEGVGEPREPAVLHPDREIGALDVGRGNVARIGIALDGLRRGPDADGGAVAARLDRAIRPVNLLDRRISASAPNASSMALR